MISIYADAGIKKKYMYIGVASISKSLNIKYSKKVGKGDPHNAEEIAVATAFNIVKDLCFEEPITIYSDSESLVEVINSETYSANTLITYPNLSQIKEILISNPNIKVKWISSKKNMAHSLVNYAYKDVFFDEVLIPNNNDTCVNNQNEFLKEDYNELRNNIQLLKNDISKKDMIINDLMNLINKLSNSIIT